MPENKSLGQIAFEGAFLHWLAEDEVDEDVTTDPEKAWLEQDDMDCCLKRVQWEAAAQAVRNAVIEECIQIVQSGVQWKPEENFSDNWRKAARQTAYHLADALRSLKGETDNG